jgi:hypothetical protein
LFFEVFIGKEYKIMNRSYSKIRHIQEVNRNLVNRVINEQSGDFYSYLKSKGYTVYKNWPQEITDSNLYKKIKESIKELDYSPNIIFCENVNKGPNPIRFITDGKEVYFLVNFYPYQVAENFPNPLGPFKIDVIKKYL